MPRTRRYNRCSEADPGSRVPSYCNVVICTYVFNDKDQSWEVSLRVHRISTFAEDLPAAFTEDTPKIPIATDAQETALSSSAHSWTSATEVNGYGSPLINLVNSRESPNAAVS